MSTSSNHFDQPMQIVRAVGELRSALDAVRRAGLAATATGGSAPLASAQIASAQLASAQLASAPLAPAPLASAQLESAPLASARAESPRPRSAIGLVPTMGALHEGHLSLIGRARAECGFVVVSLFVNPAQFDERADLDGYPREESRDCRLAAEAGADVLFAPSVEEVYPQGFATSVEVLGITDRLEGAARGAEHFRGVTTVVTKLLNMAAPDVAYFGQKDAQQVIVIRRLVEDLNIPVRIETCPTVREPDGLAMSSRNARLDAGERARAVALHRALQAAQAVAAGGERSAEALLAAAYAAMEPFALEPEYVALVDPATLEPVQSLGAPALLAIAARVGTTRLIDNAIVEPASSSVRHPRRRPAAAGQHTDDRNRLTV